MSLTRLKKGRELDKMYVENEIAKLCIFINNNLYNKRCCRGHFTII